jgi:hypothetical protein
LDEQTASPLFSSIIITNKLLTASPLQTAIW